MFGRKPFEKLLVNIVFKMRIMCGSIRSDTMRIEIESKKLKGNKMKKQEYIEWLTPDDLEKELHIKKSTQAKLRMRRLLPFSKFGKFVYYNRQEIDQLLAKHKIEVSNA